MNEILSDTRAVLLWLFGVIGTLLGIIGLFAMSILRRHIGRIDKLEAEVVRRAEFDRLRADSQAKHKENTDRLNAGFGRIEALMKGDRKETDEHREKLRKSVEDIRLDVAVLKAEGPFDDAGRLRR
jgi:hypothetical protein